MKPSLALAFALLVASAVSAQVVVIDNDGSMQKGRSLLVSPDGSVRLATDRQPIELKLESIAEVVYEARTPNLLDKGWELYLNSDDPRRRDILAGFPGDETTKDHIRMSGTDAGDIDVPLVFALALCSRANGEPPAVEFNPDSLKEDELIFRSGDAGNETRDRDKGHVLGVGREAITFKSSLFAAERKYRVPDVDRVLFAALKSTVELQGIQVTVSTRRGTRVTGRLLEMNDKVCRVETTFQYRKKPYVLDLLADSVMSILVRNGNLVYLSDLTPVARQTWSGVIEDPEAAPDAPREPVFFLDRGVQSAAPASIRGVRFRKSISTRRHVELEFRLDGNFSRFSAIAGVSDEAEPKEHAQPRMKFRVLADGKEVWASKLATWESPGEDVRLDVRGVQILVLVSDFEEFSDALTWGVWGDARVVR
ncbi:MAG: NPCBM/NEW2 domain-containing protein [Candidatus Brocadiae bacterium]|nr:NPCBM/NEW2 domain-containing protein [Candidatus Brocadiia bacterium]